MIDQHDWLIGGDCNTIRSLEERNDIDNFDLQAAIDFNVVMDVLNELDIVGGSFTWSNQSTTNPIYSRIDRMFVSDGWLR